MFYDTRKNDHGLPHNPFKAIVTPRPIGWVTTMSAKGEINLAPYSFFNGITDKPPIVMFSSEGAKDSVVFAEETKEFVCNLSTWDLRDQMNGTSAPLSRGDSEMKFTGLEAAPSRLVKPPRVAASPCALECKWLQTVRLSDVEGKALERYVVFGQAIGVYIDDRFIKNGRLDTAAMKPIARCGYDEYAVVESVFKMTRRNKRVYARLRRAMAAAAPDAAASIAISSPSKNSSRLDVVAQRRLLALHLVQAILDHIADRHDAGQAPLLEHRQMTEFALRHPLHHRADGIRQAARHDASGHHIGQRQFERSRAVGRELLHDVALRHDADDAPVRAGDDQCADGMLGEKAGRSRKVFGGLDGQNIGALFRQNGFDGHGVAPFRIASCPALSP